MIVTLISLGAAIILYIPYSMWSANGPRGGSAIGLLYGVIGYVLMLFAGLLGARKKRPVWRLGRAQTWMRGHLWLGLLSLPLILFHAGFAWRGPLTYLMMVLFFIVVGSGILGAVLQHYVPHLILQRVPMETIYEQIPRVRPQLLSEADRIVESVCGPLEPAGEAGDNAVAPEAATVAVVTDVDDDARRTCIPSGHFSKTRPCRARSWPTIARLGRCFSLTGGCCRSSCIPVWRTSKISAKRSAS